MKKSLKVAIVHDYLREYGGAERVVEAIHEIWPKAPVYVGFVDWQALGIHAQRFRDWEIRETWIARLPFYKKLFSPYRIFAKFAFEALDLQDFDLVISSSNAYMAKAVKTRAGCHLCYCHTPPRSLYGYTTMTEWQKNPLTHLVGFLINHVMRIWDFQVAGRVDLFVANSIETQRRIQKFYRRASLVVYPPVAQVEVVNEKKIGRTNNQLALNQHQLALTHNQPALTHNQPAQEQYFLYVGRLAKSKNVDLAIKACSEQGWKLKLVGSGQGLNYLQAIAGPEVEFLGAVDDQKLAELYEGATALLFPAEDEDFGIVPIEAMAHGVPVVAHRSGGPMETIIANQTGVFFADLTVESLTAAVKKLLNINFDQKIIRRQAQKFSKKTFQQNLIKIVDQQITAVEKD